VLANYWGREKKAHTLAVGAEILGDRCKPIIEIASNP
jgi:hypothetical protein